MNTVKLFAIVALTGAAAIAGLESIKPRGEADRELTIIATGGIHARVRRCGCQGEGNKPPEAVNLAKVMLSTCACKALAQRRPGSSEPIDLGAFPERSVFMKTLGAGAVVVDSGDLFFPGGEPAVWERAEWQRRAELLVELSERLRLAAFAPGELDLALGREALEKLAKRAHFPFLAANLLDARTRAAVFETRTIATENGVKLGIVGIFAPPATPELAERLAKEGLVAGDAAAAARPEVEALRREGCDLVLLLAHAPDATTRAIARAVPGIDLVVAAHPEVVTHATSFVEDGTAYSTPLEGGGILVRLRVRLVPGAHGVTDAGELIEDRSWIERLEGELAGLRRERERATPERARELDEQIRFVAQQADERRARLPAVPRHELHAQGLPLLAASWKTGQDPEVLAAIDRFKEDVERIALDPALIEQLEAPAKLPSGAVNGFATEAACAACHKAQAETWLASKHSQAWAQLERSDSQKDPECVRCHSIGFRQPGGFAEVRRVRHDGLDFANVQCEACHGALQAHPATRDVGVHLPGIETCRGCHDAEHDPTFTEKKFQEAFARSDKVCTKGLPR